MTRNNIMNIGVILIITIILFIIYHYNKCELKEEIKVDRSYDKCGSILGNPCPIDCNENYSKCIKKYD
jgi:hypothetical protein